MRSFLLSCLVTTLLIAPSVQAAESSSVPMTKKENTKARITKTVNAEAQADYQACLASAIDLREDALIKIFQTREQDLVSALTARKDALKVAMAITTAKERNAQIKTISKNYETKRVATWKTFNTSRDNRLKAYRSAKAECAKALKNEAVSKELSETINTLDTTVKAAE
jgi:hypothetical protein